MKRQSYLEQIDRYFRTHRIVAILGPRQCGKTTLAHMYSSEKKELSRRNYFDLESPADLERLQNPLLSLQPLTGLIVIDEIQRAPNLFNVLRVLVDQEKNQQQYLILGSASRELIKQ